MGINPTTENMHVAENCLYIRMCVREKKGNEIKIKRSGSISGELEKKVVERKQLYFQPYNSKFSVLSFSPML